MTTIRISYQGVPGAYSDIAAKRFFENKIETYPCHTFEELFDQVKSQNCHYGMVPIENSIAGSIHQNYDLLAKYNSLIVGEIYLKISHNLLVVPMKKIDKTKRIKMINEAYSHPQALWQCQGFFKRHPWIKTVPAEDTAGSAENLSKWRKKHIAAIASKEAAKIYSLEVLKIGIETNKNNFTRFMVIGKKQKVVKANKVSLIFSVIHKPGSLYQSLKPFSQRKINLTKIESRPILGKPWEYLFYLDFEINSLKECLMAIKELKENCLYFKILGFYKRGKVIYS